MKEIEVTTHGTSLKDLVTLANQELEVVLTQDNKPVAKVLPLASLPNPPEAAMVRRKLGLHQGAWTVSDNFDEPLPETFWLGEE
jgi:antitoxin (DNA-binding transcriptional repressor) of toxin-antitoxin stability system